MKLFKNYYHIKFLDNSYKYMDLLFFLIYKFIIKLRIIVMMISVYFLKMLKI